MNSVNPIQNSRPARGTANSRTYGEIVRRARIARRWSQAELGMRWGGRSSSLISRLENGKQPLTDIGMLRELAGLLDIPLSAFGLGGEPPSAGRTPIPHPRADTQSLEPPAQLPMDIPWFAARKAEIRRLDSMLADYRAGSTSVLITAISGAPGVGKSALAVHWAHQVADQFPDGQLYVNLRGFDPAGPMSPHDALRGFLDPLGADPKSIPQDLEGQAAQYRSLLRNRRILVVLDNALDSNQVRPLLPGTPGCVVVITSRNALTGSITKEGARPLPLAELTEDEAGELLRRRVGEERLAAEPAVAEEIVSACAGLPLVLAIVGARADMYPHHSLASLATKLQDIRTRLGLVIEESGTDLRAVFSWSYEQLNPDAQYLFRILGLHPGPDASAAAISSLAALPLDRTRALLDELTRANLVTERTLGRFDFHDLLRAYARELVSTHGRRSEHLAAARRLVDHYLHSLRIADLQLRMGRDPVILGAPEYGVTPERPSNAQEALAWCNAEHQVLLAVLNQAVAAGMDTYVWQLAWALETFLYRQGHWRDNAETSAFALSAAQRLGDRIAEARALRSLARAASARESLQEARVHLEKSLRILEFQGDRTGQGHTHAELARVLERESRYRDSLGHAERALALFQATGHLYGQARTLNDTGWIHARLGDFEKALNACSHALTLHQQLGNDEGEAHTWDSLGFAHHQLGQHDRAVDCFRQAYKLFHALGDRLNEADTLIRLGDAERASNDANAGKSWQRALEILDDLNHGRAEELRAKLSTLDF